MLPGMLAQKYMDRSGIMCVALCERVYTNGVEWMIGLLKGKVCQEGG